MRSTCTILLSSAGRRVELMQCFRASAATLGIDIRVIAVDLSPTMSAACQLADLALPVPRCEDPEFIDVMVGICADQGVDLVIPTIDPELPALSHHADRFRDVGAWVAVSEPTVVEMARDKLRTALWLEEQGIPVPRSATTDEVVAAPDDWSWPMLIKPRAGSSSIGVHLATSPDQLAWLKPGGDQTVQELLLGKEYTVNVFFDRTGQMRCAVPHRRAEVRAGEVAKGFTQRHAGLEQIAWRLGEVLSGARAALCFQAIVDDHGLAAVFEINARFGGGYPLAHRAGARFARWLLEEATGRPVSAHNDWRDGVLMLRYDAATFRHADHDR